MTREAILKELEVIFQDIFDDEDIVLTEATNSDDIEDWDSLEQINLLVAIEKKFSLKFKLDEVAKLADVGDMVSLIEKLIG